jgi:hypothetical protein
LKGFGQIYILKEVAIMENKKRKLNDGTAEFALEAKEAEVEASTAAQALKDSLHFVFDKRATRGELVELHTHLMGMGSADFWVNRIMKVFLTNKVSEPECDVKFTVEDIWGASGLHFPQSVQSRDPSWQRAILESKIFDGLKERMSVVFEERLKKGSQHEKEWFITNNKLLRILEESPKGVLRGMVRNWFQFLDVNGKDPSFADILQTCKTNLSFSPFAF